MSLDEECPEQSLFLVSALNTLSNLQMKRNDKEGALRELESELRLLMNYLQRHPQAMKAIFPLVLNMIRNWVAIRYELGHGEEVECALEEFKSRRRGCLPDMDEEGLVMYVIILKKLADIHLEVGVRDKELLENQEVRYYLKEFGDKFSETDVGISDMEGEVDERLSLLLGGVGCCEECYILDINKLRKNFKKKTKKGCW